ncbi:DoxX family protein [Taibaiella koreensis]|uniref:DoxX family protein n=1 Tax=Taibaiella koreensis TaxID=1268548 RepID=UPI000E59C8B4|nr:DoxX family protein [Taibaiella koreensis]
MNKRNRIIYWIATAWLALGMLSTAIVQLIRMKDEVSKMTGLGYPVYILTLIGVCKILGVIAVLTPRFATLKEWAYAGFFFLMTGAIFSHLAAGDPAGELFGPTLLLVLTAISWYFRPASRKAAIV